MTCASPCRKVFLQWALFLLFLSLFLNALTGLSEGTLQSCSVMMPHPITKQRKQPYVYNKVLLPRHGLFGKALVKQFF